MEEQFILEEAKKFLSENPSIDNKENAFHWACYNGHLKIAKWLLEMNPDIDISVDDECVFRHVCFRGHLELAKWLQSLYPEKYHLEIVDNKIVSYKVN